MLVGAKQQQDNQKHGLGTSLRRTSNEMGEATASVLFRFYSHLRLELMAGIESNPPSSG